VTLKLITVGTHDFNASYIPTLVTKESNEAKLLISHKRQDICAISEMCINLYQQTQIFVGGYMSSIPLPATLTIQSVASEHSELCDLIKSAESPVTIDASAVEEIDTAGMQLILSLVNQLHSQSLKTAWHSPSDIVLETADILGMSEALALPSTT